MAITTLDGALAGMTYPKDFYKAVTPNLVAGRPHSLFYLAGYPGAAVAPPTGTPAGTALTSYAGQLPFENPVSGNTYLARFSGNAGQAGVLLLCDRLWHNNGDLITSAATGTVNSVAWPARDVVGGTDGNGVYIGVEVTTITGAGTPTLQVEYTNTSGTAKRYGTNLVPTVATSAVGAFYPIALNAGDVGVKSVQTFTKSATWTSGFVSLVAYRVLARLEIMAVGIPNAIDALTAGFPLCYANTVPFLLFLPNTTTAVNVSGQVIFTQG